MSSGYHLVVRGQPERLREISRGLSESASDTPGQHFQNEMHPEGVQAWRKQISRLWHPFRVLKCFWRFTRGIAALNPRLISGTPSACFAILIVSGSLFFSPHVFAQTNSFPQKAISSQRYKIAVCDWMILKRQKLGAFQLTKDLGADGVEVDMGSLGEHETFDSVITTNAVLRQKFLDQARELNLEIPSLAMSGFYAQSFATRPTVPRMTQDCIDTMKAMNVKIAFLPLGVLSDLLKHPELRSNVVERLKIAGKQAEKAGVIIGLETELSAEDQIKLLNDVGSPAIKIYYNFANAIQNERDLIQELRTLGKERICQIHCTDQDGVWLENDPKIDMPRVKQTLDEMGWSGWLVIERSRDAKDSRNVKKNFSANAAYLKKIFQP